MTTAFMMELFSWRQHSRSEEPRSGPRLSTTIKHPATTSNTGSSETNYRPGGRDDMPPRRWQFDSRGIYVRPRTGPQSAASLPGSQRHSLGQLRHGTDRRTDRQTDLIPPLRRGHDKRRKDNFGDGHGLDPSMG